MKLINCNDKDVKKRVDKYFYAAKITDRSEVIMKIINCNNKDVKKRVDKYFYAAKIIDKYMDAAAELYLLLEEHDDTDGFEIEVWGRKKNYTIGVR
jgi:hypothetical protein